MHIVINISEDDYRKVQDGRASVSMMRKAIGNGTPLPKRHGRLIDGDYIYKKFVANKCHDSLVLQFIKDEQTIIEADKVESEDKE